jgi:hypothetical protein
MATPSRDDRPEAPLEAALRYRRMGWAVVPAAARSKRPIVRWQAFQESPPGEAMITDWFGRWPDANIAVVTGAVSGLVVLDVDPQHGGEESRAAIEAEHGTLPPTVEARTGSGGRHLYFAYPGHDVRNRTGLAPGLDLRADGGVIIVPPSIHPNGRRYYWREDRAPGDCTLAPLPPWLMEPRFSDTKPIGHSIAYWRSLVKNGVGEGQRNSIIASFAGHLLWHGVDPDVVMELLLAWNRTRCQPPLDDDEVIRTVRSIERTSARGER